jgi:pyruvate dehydrogenase E2 component (dihydrolipoamide acetyltransferase)
VENTPSKSDASPILEKTPTATPQHSSTPSFGGRTFASPIAKKIALEQGIPLAKVKGTGPDGRITRQDVESYNPVPAAPGPAASKAPSVVQDAYTDIPVSNMRRVIGTRLTQSKQEVPHYYLTVDIQMDKLLKMRQVLNSTLAEKAVKLSINDFIVKAVACALADVPEANSAWLGEVIRQYVDFTVPCRSELDIP